MSDLIVTRRHLFTVPGFSARQGFCRGGAKRWFEAQGLDWRAFVRDGIKAHKLSDTGDPMAIALVDWAEQCEDVNGQ